MANLLLEVGEAVAQDVKNNVYAKFTDAYNMAEGILSGKYTLEEGVSLLDPGSTKAWKDYFVNIADDTIAKWNAVVIRYAAFLENRKRLGIPPFNTNVVQEASVSSPDWTEEDDAYLRGVHNVVIKISKYNQDVKKGVRTIAWNSFNKDAVVLGVEGEPTILTGPQPGAAPVAYNDKDGDLLLSNFVKGQDHILNPDFVSGANIGVGTDPITVGGLIVAGLLIVCASVAAVLIVNKICDVLADHLARAEAADVRKQQNKVIDGCTSTCPPNDRACYDECLGKAVEITKATTEAIKASEAARAAAAEKSDTKALYSTVKTVSLVALGIVAIGGAGYAIYRFAGPRPRQISDNRYPQLPQGNRMIDAQVVSSRNVGEPGPLSSNRRNALNQDKKGDFYVDWDDDAAAYCVFGTESGFCYASFADDKEAEEHVKEMKIVYLGSSRNVGEPGATPVRLGYDVYNIFQQYWWGQNDPLYAVLSRRGSSVDWVTVEASEDELYRLYEVAEDILDNKDSSRTDRRVAKAFLSRMNINEPGPVA